MSKFDERDLLLEAVRNWWGPRCDTYESGCPVCAAYDQLNSLKGSKVHVLRANGVESRTQR